MHGYVLTAHSPLLWEPVAGERFAASLDTGQGFVAGNDIEQLRALGEWMEPDESLFFWPWRAAPKRAIGTGDEVYGLISGDLVEDLGEMLSAGVGVKLCPSLVERFGVGERDLALVETQGAHIPMAFWQGRVRAFRDSRKRDFAVA